MDTASRIRKAIEELVLPELGAIRQEQSQIRTVLELTNKRLDDLNAHLVDQSRRIDVLREELNARIDETNRRIDEANKRIDDTNKRIDVLREELNARIDDTNKRIDETNRRLDRLYEVVVRREEHAGLDQRVRTLERFAAEVSHKLGVSFSPAG